MARRQPWRFKHPELRRPWHTKAATQEDARNRFEGCWALRVRQGLLEHVDGNFFDGEVEPVPRGQERPDDLCSHDLNGHWWQPDKRPERTRFVKVRDPVICVLCQAIGGKE